NPIVYARVFVGEAAANDMLPTEAWIELEERMNVLCGAGWSRLVDDGRRLMRRAGLVSG
ncbi:hypothetical protein BU26DRAFT_419547, partial [Trematosphaeria pertusa]